MKKIIFLAIAIAAVCSCNRNQIIGNFTASSSTIGFDASVCDKQTKSGETEFIQFASEEIDGGYSATLEVTPIGTMADTKATINTGNNEITRTTLKTSGFYVDGYLDPESAGKYDDEEIQSDLSFFRDRHATFKEDINDCAHGIHTDGHWVFDGTAPKWRDISLHHFWAYYPEQTFTNNAYNAVSFNYTSNNTNDLVMAHHEQFWMMHADEEHGTNDELKCLDFNHPLSAVHLSKNFKFLVATDSSEKTYVEDTEGRFELNVFNMLGYNSGKCDVSNYGSDIDFDWTVDKTGGVSSMVELCQADAEGASYVIPQETSNIWIPITVVDHGTGFSFDDTWELPIKFQSGEEVTEWEPGYYYNYSFKATFKGQFVDPDDPPSYDPGFKGKTEQAAAPVGTLNFSRISELTIKWKNLPMVNNHKQVTYLIISPYEIPIEIQEDGRPNIIMNELYSKTGQEDFAALHDGNGELVLLSMTTNGSKQCILHPSTNSNISTKCGPKNNDYSTYTPVSEGQNAGVIGDSNQYGVIMHINVANLNLTGRQYIYLLYYDGSEATQFTNWPIENMTITIDSRR